MLAKRLSLSLLAVGVISLIVSAASFALFTAQTTNENNTFTAGTVTIGNLTGCGNTINNIAPGDSGTFNCQVTYTGNLDAWLGLSTTSGGDLMTCDGANSLQVAITSGAQSFGTNAADQVIGAAPVSNGTTKTFTVNWNLPLAAGNSCQGDTANVALQVKAVQSKNNTNAANNGPNAWN